MAKRHAEAQQVGDDSFLDTIANLIGILIILVVVVGARGFSAAREAVAIEVRQQLEQVSAPLQVAKRIDDDLASQEYDLQKYEQELAYRSAERLATVDQVTIAKKILDEEVNKLDDETRDRFEIEAELTELQRQLAELLQQQGDVSNQKNPPAILQHLPTPMAKTVFGHEVHAMLRGGKITVVPWNELVDALKREARGAVERNSQRNRITNTLGPIGGFTMKYALKSQSGLVTNGVNAGMGKLVELDRFILIPGEDILQETIDQALGPGGRLRAELTTHQNRNVTVTVWVYPDSFQVFRALKERLFPEGFLCAARPLPFDIPIGASPHGSSSTAQ